MSEYQTILAQLQACENQDERDRLSLNFSLSRLPEQMQAAVQAAAVPRFFDRAFLNTLLEQPLDAEQFVELTGFSYIEPYPGKDRFNVHERTRKLLQEKLWQEDESLYREISRRAFVYCAAQDQNDTTWRIETVYHQLVAEPEKGTIALNDTCVDWMNPPHFAYDKTESLLLAVHEHQKMERLPEQVGHYFFLHQAKVHVRYSRFQKAKEVLRQISLLAGRDDLYLAVEKLKTFGYAHRYLAEFSEARQFFEEALLLYRKTDNRLGEAECLLRLGEVHHRLSKPQKARGYHEEALQIYRKLGDHLGEANCLLKLGDVYLGLFEFVAARPLYEKAMILYRERGTRMGEADCLKSLGDMYRFLSEFRKAKICCEEALRLYRDIDAWLGEANSLKSLGQICLSLSEFPEARQYLEKTLKLQQKIGNQLGEASCLRLFGELEVKTGNYPLAQEYYTQAVIRYEHIHRNEGVALCMEGFAKLHQAQNQLPQAEECWRKAAEIYRNLAMPLRAERCLEQIKPQP